MSEPAWPVIDPAVVRTEVVAKLNAALAKAQAEFPPIKREQTVSTGTYSYNYASLDVIFAAVRRPLTANGLALVQMLEDDGLRTEIRHSAGGVIGAKFPLPTVPAKPQELGSLLTYLRRYAVMAILGIATEDDDDGAAAQTAEPASDKRSDAQNRKVFALIKDLDTLRAQPWPPHADWKTAIDSRCHELYERGLGEITKAQASTLIEDLTVYVKQLTESPPKPDSPFVEPEAQDSLVMAGDEDIPF